ncbi:hypothetical protein ACTXGQ_09795 [Marinobacter sp. 1Y8]
MKRLLIVLVVLLVAGLATAQYKISSSVADGLDAAKRAMRGHAQLEYSDVSTTLSGDIEISDVQFTSPKGQQIHADKIALVTGSLWQLLTLEDTFKNNEVPEHLAVSVEGLLADAALFNNAGQTNPMGRLDTAGCGERRFFDRSDLKDMGYETLMLDMKMGYQLAKGDNQLILSIDVVSREQMAVDLEMTTRLPYAPSLAGMSGGDLAKASQLTAATIKFEDLGYLKRSMAFCADEVGMDTVTYREHHLAAWIDEWKNLGLVPSDSLVDIYRDYATNPGSTLTFEMEPFPALDLGSNYLSPDPVYLSSRLNPRLGTEVTGMQPVSIASSEPAVADANTPQADSPAQKPVSQGKTNMAAATSAPAGQLALNSLDKHLYQDVAISMNNGRVLKGRIEAVEGQTLKLKRQLHGGNMVVPVALGEVKTVILR